MQSALDSNHGCCLLYGVLCSILCCVMAISCGRDDGKFVMRMKFGGSLIKSHYLLPLCVFDAYVMT